MATKFLLDAHAVIWHLEANSRMSSRARAIFADPAAELALPAITLAEAMSVVEKGRTRLPSVDGLLNSIFADPRIDILPLTIEVLIAGQAAAVIPEIHDRLLVATGLALQSAGHVVEIVTKDQWITQSRLLPI